MLTAIGRLFFHSPSRDFHCGMRALGKDSNERMDIRSTSMVQASGLGMRVSEVPTTLSPDGRSHRPHLRTSSPHLARCLAAFALPVDVQPPLAIQRARSYVMLTSV